ncbi:MAG: peptidase T [Ruminococcaceae bacterium]|nr:peptidase T [Oscillospiraceae bacterium]
MKAYERFVKYAAVHTTSDEDSTTSPSTMRQFDLANMLVDELKSLGINDAYVDEYCYVYAHIPAAKGYEKAKRIGFIAHMDTAPDFCGENVKPQIIENYDGGDVVLGISGRTLKVSDFPHLPSLKGRTLITTDGNTLLGADDKAGVAEIMTMAEKLMSENIPHGPVCICFTPDEEIGRGTEHFDLDAFAADFAYTLDGGEAGEIVYENFNAGAADFEINGFNIHPGEAKNTMINALLVATEINSMLPNGETPRDTERYEGFYHLVRIGGTVEKAYVSYIIRDHSAEIFKARKNTMQHIEKLLNEKYGEGTVKLTLSDQYRNMEEMVRPHMHLIDNAKAAMTELGIEPFTEPIRGGTDGATLSYMGLPCPNLGTGGYAFHGPFEHITAEGMDNALAIVLEIIKKYAE